jgi:hypothetical protein
VGKETVQLDLDRERFEALYVRLMTRAISRGESGRFPPAAGLQ